MASDGVYVPSNCDICIRELRFFLELCKIFILSVNEEDKCINK